MESEESQKLGLVKKPATLVENQFLTKSVDRANFQHYIFRNIGSKELTFQNCDFSYCVFERAYFHACKFVNCKFIGARFVDCNFRGATFDGCSFEYAVFKSTLISQIEMLRNLPAWPNVRRELLRDLRINAESIGDAEAVKEYVREELAASREHLKKAREGKESYYAKKYKGVRKKLFVYWQGAGVWIDWHLWGHGEYPSRLLRTILVILICATFYMVVTDQQITGAASLSNIFSITVKHFADVTKTFVGTTPVLFPESLAALLSLFRYVALGLFISVLYKRLARR